MPDGTPRTLTTQREPSSRTRAQTTLRWELLVGLIRKDLKIKYQGSVLGFVWSLMNPLLLLIVYSFVFQIVLKAGVPAFGLYLLCGLLSWNFFAGAVGQAVDCVLGNSGLVKKVRFPLAVLPLTAVGFNLVHYVLQMLVLLVGMILSGYATAHWSVWGVILAVPAVLVLFTLTTGMSYLVAALNVRYRDVKHIVEVALMAGFWLNPIIYSASLVKTQLSSTLYWLYYLNPIAGVVVTMQRAFYGADQMITNPLTGEQTLVVADPGRLFYLEVLAMGGVVSLLILALGWIVYHRMSADFAEEL